MCCVGRVFLRLRACVFVLVVLCCVMLCVCVVLCLHCVCVLCLCVALCYDVLCVV